MKLELDIQSSRIHNRPLSHQQREVFFYVNLDFLVKKNHSLGKMYLDCKNGERWLVRGLSGQVCLPPSLMTRV